MSAPLTSQLLSAVAMDDVAGVQRILEQEGMYDINGRSKSGYTPLQFAADNDCVGITKKLLKNGANINAQGSAFQNTALHMATFKGHDKVVALLCKHKDVDFALKNRFGHTALDTAVMQRMKPCEKLIGENMPPETSEDVLETMMNSFGFVSDFVLSGVTAAGSAAASAVGSGSGGASAAKKSPTKNKPPSRGRPRARPSACGSGGVGSSPTSPRPHRASEGPATPTSRGRGNNSRDNSRGGGRSASPRSPGLSDGPGRRLSDGPSRRSQSPRSPRGHGGRSQSPRPERRSETNDGAASPRANDRFVPPRGARPEDGSSFLSAFQTQGARSSGLPGKAFN